ncbi:biotin synthase BioB [Clostridium sediminicola]|uniref:biotin synthase BioB n=1 Tax=Clostridium sediminicola TaxID=3114879 RepID=UPI0031F1E5A9
MDIIIMDLKNKVLNGEFINFQEALELSKTEDLEGLIKAAKEIKLKFNDNKVNLCTIVNAKSGKCSENCRFCAQSAYHKTDVKEYELIDSEKIIEDAKEKERQGADSFSIVTSGKGLEDHDFDKVIEVIKTLKKETDLKVCGSFGVITHDKFLRLKEVGLEHYHHNLQTSESYFKNIITTHSYEDRINTIKNAKKAGVGVCAGGIFGMGESPEDRIKMALELRNLNVDNVPINILVPVKGTALESVGVLKYDEILRYIAVYRFILPKTNLVFGAGREYIRGKEEEVLNAGITSMITGTLLTIDGCEIEKDKRMVDSLL